MRTLSHTFAENAHTFAENTLAFADFSFFLDYAGEKASLPKVPRWHFGGKGINFLLDNPHATQKTPGAAIGKSNRTAKRLTKALQEKGLLVRKNGKRNGILEVQT